MKSALLFFWHSLFSDFPSYELRLFYFNFLLGNTCSNNSSLHRSIKLFCIGGVSIGERTTINRAVTLDGRGGLKIGNRVSVSEGVKILTASHEVNSESFNLILKPVFVEDYVWIGANAIILPGVLVGFGAVVGAGSVVVKNVEPHTVVCGNPAIVISTRVGNLNYDPTWRPIFF